MRSSVVACLLLGGSSTSFWCHKTKEGLCESSSEDVFSQEEMREFVRNMSSVPKRISSETVDASTIKNKVLAGYQGWAGARGTWDHWSHNGKAPNPASKNEHFEMVPETREYPSSSLRDTHFKYNGNGGVVKLYENAVDGVVDLHFKWMKEYGLDGVLLQRFIEEVTRPGKALTARNTILEQMDVAAEKHGRVYAMMWDMSGASKQWDTVIKNDWKKYVKKYTSSKQYLKENGKPVVCIFGIGLTDRQQATPSASLKLIRWLQDQGLYVIGSGPYYWRTGGHYDAASGFDKVHAAFDAIMPWAVGRYHTVSDFMKKVPIIEADAKLTSGRNQGYAPIAYAGYSYRDSNKFNYIKRNAGQFFRAQIHSHLKTPGTTFYYIAMWDEVQEGTAIYKFAANEAESAKGRPFLTASTDGVECPGDLYLTITGQYTAAAHAPTPTPVPTPPAPTPTPAPTPSGSDTLSAGNSLHKGDQLTSASGNARLAMQSDGNLVLYSGRHVVWSPHSDNKHGDHLAFQASDGNLVLYDTSSKAIWISHAHHGAVKMVLGDDCNLVVLDRNAEVLWSLGTSCNSELTV